MNDKLRAAIESFRSGNKEAFTEIYNLQFNHVYYIALQHAKNEQEAQDIAQESFIEIYRSLDSLHEINNFNAWINRIVYSFFIKSIRSKQVSERVHLNETTNLEEIVSSDEMQNPSDQYISEELLGAVEVSFQSLSSPLQEVARMRFYDELSIPEISEVLNLPQGTVKSRINRLRTILQENLSQEYQQIRVALAPVLYLYFKNAIQATQAIKSSKGAHEIAALATVGGLAAPKKLKKLKPSTVMISATVLVAPILVINQLDQAVPKIESVDFDSNWTNSNIPATIKFSSDNKNNSHVSAELNGAPLSWQNSETFLIPENGELKILFKEQILYSNRIESIDFESPTLTLSEDEGHLYIELNDDKSGVEYDSISITNSNQESVSYSIQDSKLTIDKSNNLDYLISGKDRAGNDFSYEVKSIQQ